MKGTLILLPLTWYLHETFHSSTPPQICLTKCSPHLKIIHPTLKQQQPNTLTHLSFPCRTQLNQASGGNALLQTNSHKNDWIPAGESSVSTLGEKMKKNEVIREIFDTEKAPARSQPASLFVLTLPVLLNSLIFLKVSPQFLHQHTRKIQRSHAYFPVFSCGVTKEGMGNSISDQLHTRGQNVHKLRTMFISELL